MLLNQIARLSDYSPLKARRWFGRPKEGPGPQETFQGEFQLTPAAEALPPSISHQSQTPVNLPSSSGSISSNVTVRPAQRSPSAPARSRIVRREGAAGTQHGERRPSVSAREAPSTALVGRLEVERTPPEAGPSKRRRASISKHGPSSSHPNVPTIQAAGGQFSSRRGSNNAPPEMLASPDSYSPDPSSWPPSMPTPDPFRGVQPRSPVSHGAGLHTPGTHSSAGSVGRGQFSPLSPPRLTGPPSTMSLPLMSPSHHHYRHRSDDFEPSPTADNASWHFPSPAPRTPLSLGGASIPPSIQSDASPYMDLAFGDFSPSVGPTGEPPTSTTYRADVLMALMAQTPPRRSTCPP